MSDDKPDKLESEDAALVTLCRYSYLHEALLARELLESEGVPALVPDEHLASIGAGYTNAMGGIRLQVREDDVERAAEILELDLGS